MALDSIRLCREYSVNARLKRIQNALTMSYVQFQSMGYQEDRESRYAVMYIAQPVDLELEISIKGQRWKPQ